MGLQKKKPYGEVLLQIKELPGAQLERIFPRTTNKVYEVLDPSVSRKIAEVVAWPWADFRRHVILNVFEERRKMRLR